MGNNHKYKVGEFAFKDFKLVQITGMENDRVTDTTDGLSSTYSCDLRDCMVPLTIENKVISDNFAYWHSRLHREVKRPIKWPDLHRFFVQKWLCSLNEPEENLTATVLEFDSFCKGIIDGTITTYDRI